MLLLLLLPHNSHLLLHSFFPLRSFIRDLFKDKHCDEGWITEWLRLKCLLLCQESYAWFSLSRDILQPPSPTSAYMITFSNLGPLPFSCHYCFYLSTLFTLWHLTQLVTFFCTMFCLPTVSLFFTTIFPLPSTLLIIRYTKNKFYLVLNESNSGQEWLREFWSDQLDILVESENIGS